ncbi:major capsid protein [Microbacterium phage RikSengupta]|nr:major capsid protein [Microbacterium phage TinyMiny]UVF61348.1 major capsid protein [Microbacterium phage Sparcetus]WMI33115.1 major capsid protein [Microbacterium phage RikSengupta]
MRLFTFPSIHGHDGGINDTRDVLVTATTDGVDYNAMWAEFQASVLLQNGERQAIIDFLTFDVTENIETVAQLSSAKFERASEYGEPRGVRQKPSSFSIGYDFGWYDLAARYTWQFLADATASQVEAIHSAALDADNRLMFEIVLSALYNNANRTADIDGLEVPVKALYNADGTVPPKYKTNVFDGTHNHYLTSGAATITSEDLDDLIEHLRHHGYDKTNGVTQVLLVNSREGKVIRQFRQSNGDTYDFIPATSEPQDLILEATQTVSGGRPGPSYGGLNVIGKYGDVLIIEDDLFPVGYVVIVGTGGRQNLNNPVGLRQHKNTALRGMRLVKGRDADYPLIDSFYNRGVGTGIRQRGGSAVMQITANPSYSAPTEYLPA